jgi:serralysin
LHISEIRIRVYLYFERTQGWSREEVDRVVLGRYEPTCSYRPFDPKSVMMYAIPKELTNNKLVVGGNGELSQSDKEFAKALYAGR